MKLFPRTLSLCLSSSLAAAGMLYELMVAQLLSVSLGGTLLQYSLTIGLFTLALGLSSLCYPLVTSRLKTRPAFFVLQLATLALALGLYALLALAFQSGVRSPVALFYLAPLLVGLVTGFELPLLLEGHDREGKAALIAADYLGMFLATLAFPLWLLPAYGPFGAALLGAALNLLTALACFFARAGGHAGMKKAAASLAFLFSLCGISCQFLLVRALDPFVQDEVLCQSVTLGVYLLGMGAGAALLSRRSPRFPLRILFRAELALAMLAALLVPLCYSAFVALELFSDSWLLTSFGASKLFLLAVFQPLAFALGALSGMEIPLLSQWLESRGGKNSVTFALAFSYFGAIGGAFFISFLLLPSLTLGTSALAMSLLTLLLACAIPFLPQESRRVQRAPPAAAAIVGLQLLLGNSLPALEQAMLKTGYLELRLGEYSPQGVRQWWHALKGFAPVERHQTRYQTIDLIPDRFLLGDPTRADFAMYLNFQPQFTRDSAPAYHESMVFGALALARNTLKKALVLGGGDGLIVRELLRAGAEEVVLVELDPAMLALAQNHPVLRALNQDSLRDRRVRLVTGDAFRFARESHERFDGIFADLPFPVSYDLLKLYSVEFYSALRARLNEGGFLVFDAPLRGGQGGHAPKPAPQEIFHATLQAAGWAQLLAFGPMEPFFFASDSSSAPSFDYGRLPAGLAGKTLFNLAALPWALSGNPDPALVNSALRPRRVRW